MRDIFSMHPTFSSYIFALYFQYIYLHVATRTYGDAYGQFAVQHPHRGFETITIAFQGEVEHRDSVGNHDVIGPGDVQWMTAARGIIHEEYHSEKFTAKVGASTRVCPASACEFACGVIPRMSAERVQSVSSKHVPSDGCLSPQAICNLCLMFVLASFVLAP